ncbi:MAG: sarcosine oxidase subunit gamma [Nocardioidaceae bacterium]|nr:sarcosine oxidase subunit gamma [Nocardioidaceae bacterium]
MATEALRRRTPLGPLAEELEQACAGERFSCREDAFRNLAEVRCAAGAEPEAAAILERELPRIGSLAITGDALVLGLGPGWWMSDSPAGTPTLAGSATVSIVDVSAQRTPLILTGSAARDVISHGCSLDVHPEHFGVGAAAQTLLAKAGVALARTDVDQYRVWVRASFARYLATWLIDASLEYR